MVVHVVRLEPPEYDWVMVGGKRFRCHGWGKCKGEYCTFHNPSEHHMTDWEMVCRQDRFYLIERICEHGVGHPDPDSVSSIIRRGTEQGMADRVTGIDIHGCDGCCRVPTSVS